MAGEFPPIPGLPGNMPQNTEKATREGLVQVAAREYNFGIDVNLSQYTLFPEAAKKAGIKPTVIVTSSYPGMAFIPSIELQGFFEKIMPGRTVGILRVDCSFENIDLYIAPIDRQSNLEWANQAIVVPDQKAVGRRIKINPLKSVATITRVPAKELFQKGPQAERVESGEEIDPIVVRSIAHLLTFSPPPPPQGPQSSAQTENPFPIKRDLYLQK